MKIYKTILLAGICGLALTLGGCEEKGEPPEVAVCGVPVIVGTTTPSELENQGFETDDLGAMILELPDRSWTSSIFLKKDNVYYGSMTLANLEKESKSIGDCLIEEISFYDLEDSEKADLDITINGVNPIGMSQEELKKAYPDLKLDDGTGDYLFHYLNSGKYSIQFEYAMEKLTDINVSHKFDKSYETK